MTSDQWREKLRQAFPGDAHLADGDASNFRVAIRSVTLENGTSIPIQKSGVTAIVGGNNAGKSTLLRETNNLLNQHPHLPATPGISVRSIELDREGDAADATAWIGETSIFSTDGRQAGFRRANTGLVAPGDIDRLWKKGIHSLAELTPFLTFYGNVEARLHIGGTTERRELVDDPPMHALHHLEDSQELFNQISNISKDIFGTRLTLDPLGRSVKLRMGELEAEMPRINEVSPQFRDTMAALPPLDGQGDGMRSLMGQLLPVVTGAYRIIILDEPEAFLHPPQAHALGRELGKLSVANNIQILIATHDRSLLTGLLASDVAVSVVRLSRGEGSPSAKKLDPEDLRQLWSDPVLKYTNVLDGLFHRFVVVAEAEGDCAYLAAALDSKLETDAAIPRHEVLFIPSGGKDGMAKVCRSLSMAGVPVVAAPDLDALSDKSKLATLLQSLGGEWDENLELQWTRATERIRNAREPANIGQILDALSQALTDRRDEPYSRAVREEIGVHLRTSASGWLEVKRFGIDAFKGQEYTSAISLLDALDSQGLILVRDGELENLAPEVEERKGSRWITSALSQNAQSNSRTQAHITRILESSHRKFHGLTTDLR